MPLSRVAAKTALATAIAAETSLATALVREGVPTDVPTPTDRVYVLRAVEDGERDRPIQQQGFTETFTIRVLVEVRTYGQADTDGSGSEGRAEDIFDLIDGVINADPSLGGTVGDSAIQSFDSTTGALEDGWLTKMLIGVRAGGLV